MAKTEKSQVQREQLCDRVLVLIGRHPGIPKPRLGTLVGCARGNINHILTTLADRGEIRLACDRFASKVHPQIRYWAIDYEPGIRDSKLFQAMRSPNPCKIYFDPYFDPSPISAPALQRPSIAPPTLPIATMNQPDPIADHISKFAASKSQAAKVSPAHLEAIAETKETEVYVLQQRTAELEKRNRELLSQVQDVDETVLAALQADEERLRAALQRIDKELQQAQKERGSVIQKLYGIQQAIELRTSEPTLTTFELVILNGNDNHTLKGDVE